METITIDEKKTQQEKNKEYYSKNKLVLQQKYKSKVLCPLCDKEVSKSSLNNHMKSKLCAKGFKVKMLLKRVNPDLDEYFTQV